jgi:uncharacterized RDD family membrane protein YckC
MNNDAALLGGANRVVGRRIAAALIDLVMLAVAFVLTSLAFGKVDTTARDDMFSQQISLTGWPFAVYCVFVFAYFILMEWRVGGTLGKLFMEVQVINRAGGRISFQASLVRNVLRVVDAFPFVLPYLVGLLVVAASRNNQRVGDMAAGTLVVAGHLPLEQPSEAGQFGRRDQ